MSVSEDLALLCTKVTTGPTYRQWLRICRLAGESHEVAEHELKEAILNNEVVVTWHEKCGEFHLTPAVRT